MSHTNGCSVVSDATILQVLDGDNVFLAFQDHELRIRDKSSWNKYYYTPTSLDSGVRALNTWLTTLAEQVPWAPGAKSAQNPAALPRRQLLDRFHSHTKICPSCSMVSHAAEFRWLLSPPPPPPMHSPLLCLRLTIRNAMSRRKWEWGRSSPRIPVAKSIPCQMLQ